MQIYGTLENAQIEILSSDPSAAAQTGRIWWNTTTGQIKSSDGTNLRALLRNDQKAIVGNDGTASNNVRLNRGAPGLIQFVTGADATAEGSLSTALAKLSFKVESYAFASLPAAGNIGRLAYTTDTLELYIDTGASFVNVLSSSTGVLPISKGGTNGTTATTGFNNLSPLTTKGDLISRDVTNNIRVAVGGNGQVLTADSAQASGISWTTPISVDSSQQLDNASLATSVSSPDLTISLKTRAGSDPTAGNPVIYGSRTLSPSVSGYNYEKLTITSALSITLIGNITPALASTLGFASGVDSWIYVYLYDRASVPELAVSATLFDEGLLTTSSAVSPSGTSNRTMYTTTASATARSYRLIGRILAQHSSGIWSVNPNAATPNKSSVIPFEKQLIYAEFSTTTAQTFPRNAITIVNYSTLSTDTLNTVVTGASWSFTAPKAGIYSISSAVRFNAITTSADQFIILLLYKNGAQNKTVGEKQHVGSGGSGVFSIQGASTVNLAAGDTMNMRIQTADGGTAMPTLQLDGSAADNWITVSYLGFI